MELYFKEFGAGNPVLILHGLFGFSDNWQTIAKALSQEYLVYTPDLRNHGKSPHAPTHTYSELADDLQQFMENHWMHHAAVIGHSMGGKVAMQLALNHPDMVEKLVVVDIAPGQATDNHRQIFEALGRLDFQKITTRQAADQFLTEHIEDFGTRQFLLKNITRQPDGSLTWKMNLEILTREYPKILMPVQPPAPGEVFDKPTLFIRGGKSNYLKNNDLHAIHQLFPQATMVTIEQAGHWVHADQPAELLAVVQQFLKEG